MSIPPGCSAGLIGSLLYKISFVIRPLPKGTGLCPVIQIQSIITNEEIRPKYLLMVQDKDL